MDVQALGFEDSSLLPTTKYLVPELVPAGSFVVIDSPLQPLTGKLTSHRSAWAKLLAAQLKLCGCKVKVVESKTLPQERRDLYASADFVLFELGMENHRGGNASNLYGGFPKAEPGLLFLAEAFQAHPQKMICMDRKFLDLSVIYDRKDCGYDTETKESWKAFWKAWSIVMPSALRVFQSQTLYLGDSHVLSQAYPYAEVIRLDGQTLYGALKDNIVHRLVEPHHVDVRLFFGNIDVRHHIMRQTNPEGSISAMIEDLWTVCFALSIGDNAYRRFYVHEVFPIESIVRKIPKTGWYKGEPYFGSWEERDWARNSFNFYLRKKFGDHSVLTFPIQAPFMNGVGELDFGVMEQPQSVHLAYPHYRYNFDTLEARY